MRLRNLSYHCLLCLGLGGLAPSSADAAEPASFATPRATFTGAGPVAIAVGDLNGDGTPDVATANLAAMSRTLLLGEGTGFFERDLDLPLTGTSGSPNDIALGDFNCDGGQDVVTVRATGLTFLYSGPAALQPQSREHALADAVDLHGAATGDFDGKCGKELVTLSDSRRAAVVLRHASGGVLQVGLFPLGTTPLDVAAKGDITFDGHEDFVVLGENNKVFLMSGKGEGDFYFPPKAFDVPAGARRVALADANGDGHTDILVAGPGFVATLLGDGNGEFNVQPPVPSGTLVNPTSFVTADFNLDGLPDVALASSHSLGIWIYYNQGAGRFAQPWFHFTLSPVSSLAVGDFDTNGKPDLVATESWIDLVVVRLNTTNTGMSPEAPDEVPHYIQADGTLFISGN
jgi:hypothetical protein